MSYTDRTAFEAAAGAVVKEGFEDETLGDVDLGVPLNGSGLAVDIFSGAVQVFIEAGDPDAHGFENTTPAGANYLGFGKFGDVGTFTASFTGPGPMTAIGFDLSGFQPVATTSGRFLVDLLLGGSSVGTLIVLDDSDFGIDFHGFISSAAFDTINLTFRGFPDTESEPGVADFVAFDEVTFNTAPTRVPEPTSLVLLGAGLAALGFRKRRA